MEMKDRIMKFGDDVKSGAEKLAKGAIDGSKKVAEKVKLKNAISQAESHLNAVYMEIGKKYEETYADREDAEFADLLADVRDAKTKIAITKAELAAVDSATICPTCGKYVLEGQLFCPYCGTKQEKPEPVEEPVEEVAAEEVTEEVAEAAAETEEAAE